MQTTTTITMIKTRPTPEPAIPPIMAALISFSTAIITQQTKNNNNNLIIKQNIK